VDTQKALVVFQEIPDVIWCVFVSPKRPSKISNKDLENVASGNTG